MYEQEIRTQYAQSRLAQLHRDRHEKTPSEHHTRHAIGLLLIRAGRRLASEPARRHPELSLRA
jgi:hypothetical protein